jgi:hypothetical protein
MTNGLLPSFSVSRTNSMIELADEENQASLVRGINVCDRISC